MGGPVRGPYALVFGGGGAKGAYQIGVWKALRELSIDIEAVVGTSVGALNGAMVAMGDYQAAFELWNVLTIDRVLRLPSALVKDGRLKIGRDNLEALNVLRDELFRHGGLDTTPLRELLTEYCDEKRIRRRGMDFGLVSFELSGQKPLEVFIDEIPEGKLVDYLLASSSFPGFKLADIDGKRYLDGGLVDNVPFQLAKARGYRRLIVADVSGIGMNRRPDPAGVELITVKNSMDTGNVLDFHPENARRLMEMGYLDTLRVFDKLQGFYYYYSAEKSWQDKLVRAFGAAGFQTECRALFRSKQVPERPRFEEEFRSILPEELARSRNPELALLETAALMAGLERLKTYTLGELISRVEEKLAHGGDVSGGESGMSFYDILKGVSYPARSLCVRVCAMALSYLRKPNK